MLTITGVPHRGELRTWTAEDEDDFCIKVQQAKRGGDWEHDWTFDQFRQYLAEGLRSLDISDSAAEGVTTHTDPRYEFDIRADFAQASDSLQYRLRSFSLDDDDDGWCSTPYQVADAGHRQHEAFEIVDAWLDSQGG